MKEEKSKRVSKSLFANPRGLEQIESYVKTITQNNTLKLDYKANIKRRIGMRLAHVRLRKLEPADPDNPEYYYSDYIGIYLLKKIYYLLY